VGKLLSLEIKLLFMLKFLASVKGLVNQDSLLQALCSSHENAQSGICLSKSHRLIRCAAFNLLATDYGNTLHAPILISELRFVQILRTISEIAAEAVAVHCLQPSFVIEVMREIG